MIFECVNHLIIEILLFIHFITIKQIKFYILLTILNITEIFFICIYFLQSCYINNIILIFAFANIIKRFCLFVTVIESPNFWRITHCITFVFYIIGILKYFDTSCETGMRDSKTVLACIEILTFIAENIMTKRRSNTLYSDLFLKHITNQNLDIKVHPIQNSLDEIIISFECSICMEQSNEGVLLKCGHTYHKTCIEKWRKNKSTCPLCRVEI